MVCCGALCRGGNRKPRLGRGFAHFSCAPGGTRTPNLLIRSQNRVEQSPRLSPGMPPPPGSGRGLVLPEGWLSRISRVARSPYPRGQTMIHRTSLGNVLAPGWDTAQFCYTAQFCWSLPLTMRCIVIPWPCTWSGLLRDRRIAHPFATRSPSPRSSPIQCYLAAPLAFLECRSSQAVRMLDVLVAAVSDEVGGEDLVRDGKPGQFENGGSRLVTNGRGVRPDSKRSSFCHRNGSGSTVTVRRRPGYARLNGPSGSP
jgi:hypothetical protein